MSVPEAEPEPCFIDTNIWLYAFIEPTLSNPSWEGCDKDGKPLHHTDEGR